MIVGNNVEWQGVRVFVTLYATMGCRKEAIVLGKGEVPGPRKLMLKAVVYRFDVAVVTHPSRQPSRLSQPCAATMGW